jgi:hypothetical protein
MTLEEIARKLVANCREGREHEGLAELYDPACESVEAVDPPGGSRISKGVEAIRGKHDWWAANFEMHGGDVDGPYLHGPDRFAVIFEMDVTEKASGQRWKGREVALYTVHEGRIVKEEFFQAPM